MNEVGINRVQVFVFRVPIEVPVETSFGVMTDLPTVFVCLTDLDGARGSGLIEVDINANPLRDDFFNGSLVNGGRLGIQDVPRLGIDQLPDRIAEFQTLNASMGNPA